MPTPKYKFLLENDGSIYRQDEGLRTEIWGAVNHVWRPWQINPFTASVSTISPKEAQQLIGEGQDLYAVAADPAA